MVIDIVVVETNGFSLLRDLTKHVMKGSCQFIGKKPIMVIYQPTTFGGQTHSAGEDMFLICYVILIQTRLEEKREEKHIQLQSVMQTQTQ